MTEHKSDDKELAFPLEEIMQTSSIIFYHCDIKEGFPVIYMSPNVDCVLGFENEAFRKDDKLWLRRIHDDDRDRVLSSYNDVTEEQKQIVEFRFRHKEGHFVWLRDEITLITNNRGEPDSLVGTSIEITDLKEAEKDLQGLNRSLEKRIKERTSKLATANRRLKKEIKQRHKAEAELKEQNELMKLQEMAINNLNDMVVVTKAPMDNPLDSEIIFVNQAFEKFTGYSADEVVGKKPTFLHGPETSRAALERIARQVENHESLREEFINYTKNGTPYWVELDMAPFPTDEEGYEYWVGINRNVTQRKQAEQKLEESEKRYRAFAELSFDAIFEVGLDGLILNCNRRACELFGYDREELIGMSTIELIPEKYRDKHSSIATTSATTGDEAWERTYKKKDGTLFPTEVHTEMYEVAGQKRLVAYVRDTTDRKEYEDTIRKSLKEKETLLSEVHHRVKNNLAVISGLLEMQVFNTDDEQLLEKLQESQSRIQSIAMVHEKLYSSVSFSEIKIDQYIDDLLGMISSMVDTDKEIQIEKDMDSVPLTVGQAVPCGLLLNELITNCYKHAFKGRKKGEIKISIKRKNGHIVLSVKDNGVGLPGNFEIEGESTLGMTLVSTLVRQLDGDLEVISDSGSCFRITFEIKN